MDSILASPNVVHGPNKGERQSARDPLVVLCQGHIHHFLRCLFHRSDADKGIQVALVQKVVLL